MLTRYVPVLLAIALSACSVIARADSSDQTANLPVTHVALYTSGVGYFERSGVVEDDATETLLFPIDQVNDVLKSLVLLDTGGGSIQPVTYAAQDPLEKQLRAFSIDLSDNPSRGALLNRLRGAEATVTDGAQTLTGVIVGVEDQTITLPDNQGTRVEEILNLMASGGLPSGGGAGGGDGLHALKLADVGAVTLTDPALNQELREALSVVAHGRDASKRPVKLSFSGHGRRNVLVGYLAQTPLWQTTYRLVLGDKPLLQGWALVQNTSQDDWNNVSMSLVSGRPISFIQDLYTPIYVDRPVVAAQVASAPGPQSYAANMMAKDETENAPAGAPAPPPASPMAAESTIAGGAGGFVPRHQFGLFGDTTRDQLANKEINNSLSPSDAAGQSLKSSGAKLGTSLFSYEIKVPVTVPRQQSAMIPFVSTPIQAQSVSIYNQGVEADHPLAGARLKNTSGLHLMGGPLTVFDQGSGETGYVGDAVIDDTEPNQTRLLSYAVDLAIDAEVTDEGGDSTVQSIIINKGTLIETVREISNTNYKFKNNSDKPRTIVVEHPYRGDEWKLVEPKEPSEHTPAFDRFDVDVPAGANKTLAVKLQHAVETTYGLIDIDLDILVEYTKSGDVSPDVKSAIAEVIKRRQKIATLQAAIDNRNAQLSAIASGQERIRDNMKALDHSSALYKRYVGELDAQENKIEDLHSQIDALSGEGEQEQNDLSNYVSTLSVN